MTTPNQKRNLHHQRWTFNSTDDIAEHAGDLAQKIMLDLTPLNHGAITFALLHTLITLHYGHALTGKPIADNHTLQILHTILDYAKVKLNLTTITHPH